MISNVTFKVTWYDLGKKGTRVEIFPGNVENVVGDGMPLPMYMAIVKAIMQVENDLNGKAEPPVEPQAPQPRIEVPAVSKEETSTPPHAENSSKHKA